MHILVVLARLSEFKNGVYEVRVGSGGMDRERTEEEEMEVDFFQTISTHGILKW